MAAVSEETDSTAGALGRAFLTVRHRIVLLCARLYLLAANPRLAVQFVRRLGYLPDPALPRSYHEKQLWRKLVDHNPAFVALSDKLAAKDIARARCPELGIARVLWAGRDPAGIPAPLLAGEVVVKVNHGSGYNLFVSGGAPPPAEIEARTATWLTVDYHRRWGEWGYRDVDRRVFVEERLALGGPGGATEVRVHVFGGVEVSHVRVSDTPGARTGSYTAELAPLDEGGGPRNLRPLPDGPAVRELARRAIDIACRAAGDLDYVQVDLMAVGDRLYFGEYTLNPGSGYINWPNPSVPRRMTALWDLRRSGFLRTPQRGLAGLYAEALRAALDAGAGAA